MKPYFLLICSLLFTSGCMAMPPPALKVTVRAVDEDGNPVAGARIGVGVVGGITSSPQNVRGLSDSNGLFTGEVSGLYAPGYNARKEGYYEFRDSIATILRTHGHSRRWEPWNPTVVATLRPILNPVPMYVRNISTHLPALGVPCGFDMVVSDWVAPWGKGLQPHLYFEGRREYTDWDHWGAWLKVAFVGETSGYIVHKESLAPNGSQYKLPRFAPESGYSLLFEATNDPTKPIEHPIRKNLIFRTHTVEDNDGQTLSALYGKMHGTFLISPRQNETLRVTFTYYLNPDGTRNLEFDPNRNLLKDRRDIFDRERPTAP